LLQPKAAEKQSVQKQYLSVQQLRTGPTNTVTVSWPGRSMAAYTSTRGINISHIHIDISKFVLFSFLWRTHKVKFRPILEPAYPLYLCYSYP